MTIMGILDILVIRPWKLRSSKKYFMERFGPAFFMRPAYCVACNKKPIKIKEADLCWLRPGTGIQPGMEEKVIGSIAIKNISKGTIIISEDLKK